MKIHKKMSNGVTAPLLIVSPWKASYPRRGIWDHLQWLARKGNVTMSDFVADVLASLLAAIIMDIIFPPR
jgi:hypothetical protein